MQFFVLSVKYFLIKDFKILNILRLFFRNKSAFPKIWGHPAHALLTQQFYPSDESNPRAKQIKNIHSFNCFVQPVLYNNFKINTMKTVLCSPFFLVCWHSTTRQCKNQFDPLALAIQM